MRVLVTGGTGFVGAHTVKALLDAGHEVKLLVRSPGKIGPALDPLGVTQPLEAVTGDVLDEACVARALEGCDGLIHAASVYSNDPRRDKEIRTTNLAAAKIVLGAAVDRGLDPIVHVSSIVALLPSKDRVLTESSEPGSGGPAYATSKQEQERFARSLQEQGAPVVTTYPGTVWGPFDPYDGESTRIARVFVRGMAPFRPAAGLPLVDVRDVAAAHAAIMEAGKGPRRFIMGGHYTRIPELARMACEAAGKRSRGVSIPPAMAHAGGVMAGAVQRIAPFRLPIDPSSTFVVKCDVRADNSHTESELGITFRPTAETVRDQVEWQRAAGRL